VGVSSGYAAAVLITKVILPLLVQPLRQTNGIGFFLSLVPLIMSLLLVLMIFPRTVKAGTLPLAFLVGITAALTIAGVSRGTLAPQLLSVVNRFSPDLLTHAGQPAWAQIIAAFFILLGVIAVLFYFHHHTKEKSGEGTRSNLVEGLSKIGQIFIGITFGMLFVGFYVTALAALIGQISWLKDFC